MNTEHPESLDLDQLVDEIGFDSSFNKEEALETPLASISLQNLGFKSDKENSILEKKPYNFKGGGCLGLIEIIQLTYNQFQQINLSSFYDIQKARREELKNMKLNQSDNDKNNIDEIETVEHHRSNKTTRYFDFLINRHAYFYFNCNDFFDSKQSENNFEGEKKIASKNTRHKNCSGCNDMVAEDESKSNFHSFINENKVETGISDTLHLDNDDNTGNRVYLGAILINLLLSYFPSLVRDKTVIEIGCGVGLTGVALCRLGCSKIILTDAQWNCLALAKYNISQELRMKKTIKDNKQHKFRLSSQYRFPEVIINQLRWGDDAMIRNILHENSVECNGFDVLLGGDLLYYNVDVQLLFGTIKKLLEHHRTKEENKSKPFLIVLAHLERCVGASKQFCELCTKSDLIVKEFNVGHLFQNEDDEILASSWRSGQLLICTNIMSSLPESVLSLCNDVISLDEEESESEDDMIRNTSSDW